MPMFGGKLRLAVLGFASLGSLVMPMSVGSAEVLTYNYDAIGRVTGVCHGLGGSGDAVNYALDQADNRSSSGDTRTDGALTPNSGWTSGDGRFTLWFQPDGNLVLYKNYDDHASLWSTSTSGSGAVLAHFQSDGNLVLYTSSASVWGSGTNGNFCARLGVMNDGNVIIVDTNNNILWQTGTGGH